MGSFSTNIGVRMGVFVGHGPTAEFWVSKWTCFGRCFLGPESPNLNLTPTLLFRMNREQPQAGLNLILSNYNLISGHIKKIFSNYRTSLKLIYTLVQNISNFALIQIVYTKCIKNCTLI